MTGLISALIAIIMAILSVFGVGNGGNPTPPVNTTPTGYDILTDVSYGSEDSQKFDLIIPKGIGKELSLAVYIHGGAWMGGDKSYETETFKPMAQEKGLISASLNYRLLAENRRDLNCYTQLKDIDDAVTKIVDVCSSKGYSIKKAIFWGESAGGHLALMYSYTYKDKSAVDIAMCYSICGPTNLADTNFFTKTEFLPDQMFLLQSLLTGTDINANNITTNEVFNERLKVSPINYVNASTVPTIFNSCGDDHLVPKSNAEHLEKVLKANGVDYYYAHFANSGHCGRHSLDYATYTALDKKLDEMIKKYVK